MLERRPPSFGFVAAFAQLRQRSTGRKHAISLFWDVEGNICLARRRYGPLQYQLHPLWRP